MVIRTVNSTDDLEWLRMRDLLWPGLPESQHRLEMAATTNANYIAVLVADRGDGRLGAFLELGIRSVADGCTTSPVAYIEGWFVDADLRLQGVGRLLVLEAEKLAKDRGYLEIASDCDTANAVSHTAHLAIGYQETGRMIHFRKSL